MDQRIQKALAVLMKELDEDPHAHVDWETVHLESICLVFPDEGVLRSEGVGEILPSTEASKNYELVHVHRDSRPISPRLWHLPEAFQRPVPALSPQKRHDQLIQQKIAGCIRYNFSNNTQISAQEILRHPAHRRVPLNLLPNPKVPETGWLKWPLLQSEAKIFWKQHVLDLEQVMQYLLFCVSQAVNAGEVKCFFQRGKDFHGAVPIQSFSFDRTGSFRWHTQLHRVIDELEGEFTLRAEPEQPFLIGESWAFHVTDQKLFVGSWWETWQQLSHSSLNPISPFRFKVTGEAQIRWWVRELRRRQELVSVGSGERRIEEGKYRLEVQFDNEGRFNLHLDADLDDGEKFKRKGWSTRALIFMQTLQEGLGFILNLKPAEIATKSRFKRDWDLRLLKHLGIIQYIALETLSYHFEGTLIDGSKPMGDLLESIEARIRALLIAGPGAAFVKETHLSELCSDNVMAVLRQFMNSTTAASESEEGVFEEHGEIAFQGLLDKEFRILFLMLKRLMMGTGGEFLRRSRTGFLDNISEGGINGPFFFFTPSREGYSLAESIETLQPILNSGLSLRIGGEAIEELADGDFSYDLEVETKSEQEMNWFELNPKFFFKGQPVAAEDVLDERRGGLIRYQGKLYMLPRKQLPSMARLENFWSQLRDNRFSGPKKARTERIHQLPRHRVLELLALKASGVPIQGDYEWQRICAFYDTLGQDRSHAQLPSRFTGELKAYQISGYDWVYQLYELRLGALLADDMGLGKTIQTLAFLERLREEDRLGQCLIVVPSSLTYNWVSEAAKFTPELRIETFSAKDIEAISKKLARREPMVVLLTYGLLVEHREFFEQYLWNVAVFDEAQNLKTITAKRTSAARSLRTSFKMCLTGTPMENHYGEFFSILDLCVPGCLGPWDQFRKINMSSEVLPRDRVEALRLKVKPLVLRRSKREILDQLPDKQETVTRISFEDRQREIYRDIALSFNVQVREAIRDSTTSEGSVQLQMLTALLRLRQVCSDPAGVPGVVYDRTPPKLEALLDSLEELVSAGESALVFTQFLQTLHRSEKMIKEKGIPLNILHGGMSIPQRNQSIKEFTEREGGGILLMTLKTGGVGLNLTKASYVFHLEPWWNPSVENQATDRVHRLGQKKAVQVFRYIMHESLEEKIEVLKGQKQQRFDSLFEGVETEGEIRAGGPSLTRQDFEYLLS